MLVVPNKSPPRSMRWAGFCYYTTLLGLPRQGLDRGPQAIRVVALSPSNSLLPIRGSADSKNHPSKGCFFLDEIQHKLYCFKREISN